MNTFSNMEINDLLSNRLRLEDRHTPNYLAECFQRLFPTLGRVGLSTVIDEMARANHRAFNSSRLPIRGETLDLNFFFELWKRNFRFEGGIYDKFTFGDELRLAFKISPREFWEVLIRADREMGTYLKDCFELLNRPASAIHGYAVPRDLPQAISLNLRLNGSSVDDKTIRLLREKLPFNRDNFTTHEIAKVCLQLFEVANPTDYDIRRLAEELEKENGIRRLSGEFTAVIPKKALDRLSTKCVLEFFKSKPLASNEASAMERGVYTLTEADLVLINSQGSEAFWLSIIPDKSIRERTLNMWKLAGMDSDARRFAKGKQILIATERALSDALHKHSAEMRDVYPLCGRAGISTQEADKFMAMLYLCHDFYKGLANVYINTAMLARFGAPAARRLWDTIKTEGLKKDGVGKIQGRLETETEKLNREVKEAIASPHAARPLRCNVPLCNSVAKQVACACGISASLPQGTAKITEIDLKQIDFTKYEPSKIDFDLRKIGLSQMVLMARSDYRGPSTMLEMRKLSESELFTGKSLRDGNLDSTFRKNLTEMAQEFAKKMIGEGKIWQPIILTSVARTVEGQADAMYELYLKNPPEYLWKVYKKDTGASPILAILDELFYAKQKGYDLSTYPQHAPILWNYLRRNPDFSEEREHPKGTMIRLKGATTSDPIIQKFLVQAINSTNPSAKAEIITILIHMMRNEGVYGKISQHLDGKSVDVSSSYTLLNDLKKYIDSPAETNLKYSGNYSDGHIHISGK